MSSGKPLFRLSVAVSAALTAVAGTPASAVIVSNTTLNTSAPASTPAFNNVGYAPYGAFDTGGSGVYLGDRWVLTAWHVQGGVNDGYTFVIPGTGTFLPEPGSQRQVAGADVALFRLTTDPGLPSVQFGPAPQVNTSIVMSGMGWNRQTQLKYWDLANPSQPDNTTWTDVTGTPQQGLADRTGYAWDPTGFARRWGINQTVAVGSNNSPTVEFNNTVLFGARWENQQNEAIGAPGDSGGGIWVNNRLVGINLYLGDESKDPNNPNNVGQPAQTAVFGNYTFFANLASYVDDIATLTGLHPSIDGDANLDGIVDNADFKILYDHFGTGSKWTQGDFSLDGAVDFLDFQILEANFGKFTPVPGVTQPGGVVPEPGGLAVIGLAGWLMKRRRG